MATYTCGQCDKQFRFLTQLNRHRVICQPDSLEIPSLMENFTSHTCTLKPIQSAIGGIYKEFQLKPCEDCLSADQVINAVFDGLQAILNHCLKCGNDIKVYSTIAVNYHKIDITSGEVIQKITSYFSTLATPIQSEECINEYIEEMRRKLNEDMETFINKGSNWIVSGIDHVTLRLVRFKLLGGGKACMLFQIPEELRKKHAVLNLQSPNHCFKYAICASLHHQEYNYHRERYNIYVKHLQEYDFSTINYPTTVNDIVVFQNKNKNVAINALIWNEDKKKKEQEGAVGVLYHPAHAIVKGRQMAHILLVGEHWLPITNINRLLGETGVNSAYCYRCLRNLYKNDRLEKHQERCYNNRGQQEIMPKPGEANKSFNEWSKMLSPPFVIYADMEALLLKSEKVEEEGVNILQTHKPIAVGSYLVAHSALKYPSELKLFKGRSCFDNFCQYLEELAIYIYEYNKINCKKPQDRTNKEEVENFEKATECKFCKESFEKTEKVWHHCHVSGKFIAPICQSCNTKIHQPIRTLTVVFHNLKNYDMHGLCIEGFSKRNKWTLKPIAQTREKYMTLTVTTVVAKNNLDQPIFFSIRFIDSFQFLSTSLAKLVNNLDKNTMIHTKQMRELYSHDAFPISDNVLFGKGVFPYSYLDNESKLDELSLPNIYAFDDKLTNTSMNFDDYTRARMAFLQFGCTTFGDYMYRYLELDCRLLADVFENFRQVNIGDCGLDPINYITLPQYSFSAAFLGGKQLHLLTDVEMYNHFEDGIRGGMCFVNQHFTQSIIPESYISYWDANNLYGNALMQLLPTSNFEWVEEFDTIDWLTIETDGDVGYCLRVDLIYPPSIHDATADFPLAPEMASITKNMLTPLIIRQWENCQEQRSLSTLTYKSETKLLMTVRNKKEYVVHFKLLKFYLQQGMIISKIHSVIKFKQSYSFKDYNENNSKLRQMAHSEFEKDLYKLKNNSLFGKTMENVRGRKDYKLVNTAKQLLKQTTKAQFLYAHAFDENLVIVEMQKLQVLLDKPIFIGQAVLDLSKLIMFDLRYNKLKEYEERFKGKITILGGDTDSLICSIKDIDLHAVLHPAMVKDGLLDTSNYCNTHDLHSVKLKAKLGCIKDEVAGEHIKEAVLLKPKCYSMLTMSGEQQKRTAKGVQRCERDRFTHQQYVNVYKRQEEFSCKMRRFKCKDHIVSTIEQEKWALSVVDNKRAWINANVSLPFGHYQIPQRDDDDDDVPIKRQCL